MKNIKIQALLEQAGFNEKEAAIYLAVLELGRCTILAVAKHCQIKRSTIYEFIPSLEAKGVIKKTIVGKKTFLVAENPKTIEDNLKERERRFAEAMPEMMALYNAQENRPRVFFYQGKDELQNMYEDTLRAGVPLANYTSIIDLYKYLDKDWVDDYIERRVKLEIPTRIIALDSPEAVDWAQTADTELRQIKLVPRGDYTFSADVHIYGNKMIVTTYKSGLFGLLIEDENIAQMQMMAFELMWKAAG